MRTLFTDIQVAVFDRLGRDRANAGALAEAGGTIEPSTGPGTPASASWAVLRCAVLVVLYTETYLRDARCLSEWSLFQERVRWHERITGRLTPALVGVRWALAPGFERNTAVAGTLLPGEFGPCYEESGALRLSRRNPDSTERDLLINSIADQIRAAAADPPAPMPERSLRYLGPALYPAPEEPDQQPRSAIRPTGRTARLSLTPPQRWIRSDERRGEPVAAAPVGVVVAAATVGNIPPERTREHFYGGSAADWRPFLPDDPRPAVEVARNAVARSTSSVIDVYPLETQTLAELERVARTQILLLLVDPWWAYSDSGSDLLRRFSELQIRFPTVAGVLVVFAAADGQTMEAAGELRDRLRTPLEFQPRREAGDRLANEIRSADQLTRYVVRLVTRSRNALLPFDSARRSGPGSAAPPRAPAFRVAGETGFDGAQSGKETP